MRNKANNLNAYLGQKIHSFRKKLRWPLKKLCSHLDVSIQQVHRYEHGTNKISASLLYKLAKMWDVSITNFFDGYHEEQYYCANDNVVNVVLVEDNAQDNFLIRKALEDFPKKINIHTITDGKQALKFFKNNDMVNYNMIPKPNLILMNLYLSDMKSLCILKAIKKQDSLQNVPVIILTNSMNQNDVVAAYKLHASGFIRKSSAFKEFKEQLQRIFLYWTNTVMLPS